MDEIDRQIVSYLRKDGRAAYTEIAEDIGVSEGTVRNRVEGMKEDGVIERFTVELKSEHISALVMVDLSTGVAAEEVLVSVSDDIYFYEVTGEYDIVLSIERETTEALNEELERIRSIEGVADTKTYSVLDQGII